MMLSIWQRKLNYGLVLVMKLVTLVIRITLGIAPLYLRS